MATDGAVISPFRDSGIALSFPLRRFHEKLWRIAPSWVANLKIPMEPYLILRSCRRRLVRDLVGIFYSRLSLSLSPDGTRSDFEILLAAPRERSSKDLLFSTLSLSLPPSLSFTSIVGEEDRSRWITPAPTNPGRWVKVDCIHNKMRSSACYGHIRYHLKEKKHCLEMNFFSIALPPRRRETQIWYYSNLFF